MFSFDSPSSSPRSDDDDEDWGKMSCPFLSDANCEKSFQRATTVKDLHGLLALVNHHLGNFMVESCESSIRELLNEFGYENPEQFIGEELLNVRDGDDEKTMAIKLMILIRYAQEEFNDWHEVYSQLYLPFFYYLEEKILPEITNDAKRLKEQTEQGEVSHFESNVKSLEKWQLVILNLYGELLYARLEYNDICGLIEHLENSCFIMLATFRYLIEKKEKFYKENQGMVWKDAIDQKLLLDQLKFWDGFLNLTYFTVPVIMFGDDRPFSNFLKDSTEKFRQVLVNCLYSVSEYIDKEDLTEIIIDLLCQFIFYNSFTYIENLMKHDYQEVKDLDDLTIISDEKSKNYGKVAWIIKYQVLRNLQNYVMNRNNDEIIVARTKVVFNFEKLLLDNMVKEGEEFHQVSLRELAITTSLYISTMDTKDIQEFVPPEFQELVLNIFKIWKDHFISSDFKSTIGSLIDRTFKTYIGDTGACPDDFLEVIIKKCDMNIMNFLDWNELLQAAVAKLKLRSSPERILHLREMMLKSLETLNDMDYLNNILDDYEEKISIHSTNIEKCYDIFFITLEFYEIEDFNIILSSVRTNAEKDINLTISMFGILSKIFSKRNNIELEKILERLDYYPFLTGLIRQVMSNSKYFEQLGYLFIMNFIRSGLVIHCPFDVTVTESEKEKNFMFDYMLPNIIKLASIKTDTIEESNKIPQYSLMCIIICYDIRYCQGKFTCNLCDHLSTIVREEMPLLKGPEKDDLAKEMLMAFILSIRNDLECSHLILRYSSIVFSTDTNRTISPLEYSALFEVIEYWIDNDLITIAESEVTWANYYWNNVLPTLPLYIKCQCNRIIFKITGLY